MTQRIWQGVSVLALVLAASACGTSETSGDGSTTGGTGGTDTTASSGGSSGTTTCIDGQTLCPATNSCADLNSDMANCGWCGQACTGGKVCQAAQCVCPMGSSECVPGSCTDTKSDVYHCGQCGAACPEGQVCSLGKCELQCPEGQDKCGMACFDIQTDALHCGSCSIVCATGATCIEGVCRCPENQSVCNATCVDTASSATDCGFCGVACSSGQSCVDGRCVNSSGSGGTGGVEPGLGGAPPTGGVSGGDTGGNTSGGVGGAGSGTGGNATGGRSMGGRSSGGDASGGNASGGSATGGDATGGAATGGAGGSTGAKSAGCGKTATRQDANTQLTMQVNGATRYYLLYMPANYDPDTALPLVFALHGMDMNNWWAAHDASGFGLIENSKDTALLVYPQGSGDAPGTTSKWGGISSNWTPGATGNDEQFLDALLESIEDNYCVDTSKLFFTGFSMGGWMTETFACNHWKVFRAFAPVAGWGPGGMETGHGTEPSCSDADAAVPILITQGTADTTVTPDNGQNSLAFWLGRDGCSDTTTPVFNGCVAYQGCTSGLAVDFCSHGGGHEVPGAAPGNIWSFFSQYIAN